METAKRAKSNGKKKVYNKFQYKDQIFEMGQVCRFYNSEGDLIGKIMNIVSTDPSHPDFGKLRVRWYYYKKDLEQRMKKIKLTEKQMTALSDQELFPTMHEDHVFVQAINGRVNVHTLEEFEMMEKATLDDYFTRAEFDFKRNVLKPPFEKWKKMCSCDLPQNPSQQYIQCDACLKWFHPKCEGVDPDKVEEVDFICQGCKSQNN